MGNEVIKKIFSKDQTVQIDGLVIGKKAAGIWKVRDLQGKIIFARSDATWRPNEDWVTVQAGRIVARSARRGEVQTYYIG